MRQWKRDGKTNALESRSCIDRLAITLEAFDVAQKANTNAARQ
jgi:hypothetical protein